MSVIRLARRVVCWACAAGRHYQCLGHCDCCGTWQLQIDPRRHSEVTS